MKNEVVNHFIKCIPVGKERPRKGKNGVFYTPRKTIDFEKKIISELLQYKDIIQRVYDKCGRLHIGCFIWFPNEKHPDPDNVLKSVYDAIAKLIERADKHFCGMLTFNCEPHPIEGAGVRVVIYDG